MANRSLRQPGKFLSDLIPFHIKGRDRINEKKSKRL
jgi:hypothetical protein